MPGDVVFALGALFMAWDFLLELRLFLPKVMTIFLSKLKPRIQEAQE